MCRYTLIFCFLIFTTAESLALAAKDRVRLRHVTALTLEAGRMTTGRRSDPVPQLHCSGPRSLCSKAESMSWPRVVSCSNIGWDGSDVQWKCQADFSQGVTMRLGRTTVSCEGYTHPDDEFILAGSCGLEYELVESSKYTYTDKEDSGSLTTFILFGILLVVLVFTNCCGMATQPPRSRDDYWGGDRGDYQPPPPPYNRHKSDTSSSWSSWVPNASNGPGFWSGMGMGSALGYLMGNRGGYGRPGNVYARPTSGDYGFQSSNHRSSGFGGSSSTSGTSTSYANTRRR